MGEKLAQVSVTQREKFLNIGMLCTIAFKYANISRMIDDSSVFLYLSIFLSHLMTSSLLADFSIPKS